MNQQLTFPLKVPKGTSMYQRMPSEPIHRSAEIEKVGDVTYRWTMTRAWAPGPTILWMLLNPSDADGKRDDPTTLRMIGWSYRWGFGSMIVVNAYPFASSTTPALRAWRKTVNWEHYDSPLNRNLRVISNLVSSPEVTKIVAAWGNGVDDDDFEEIRCGVRKTVNDTEFGDIGIEIDWHCIGKTKSGAPMHPLARGHHRVPDDAVLKIWKRSRGDT